MADGRRRDATAFMGGCSIRVGAISTLHFRRGTVVVLPWDPNETM